MNVLDLIIGIILLLFAFAGLRRGLIIEAFYLASFIVGIYGAMYFSDIVADWMAGFVEVGKEYLAVIAFIVTFIIFVVLIRIVGRLVSQLVHAISLGFLDKLGGFFFGIIKGALLTSIVIMIMNIFGLTSLIRKDLRNSSILYTYTESLANMLYKNHEVVKGSMAENLNQNTCFDAFAIKNA